MLVLFGGVIVPLLMCLIVCAPLYVSMWLALLLLYQPDNPGMENPFSNALWDVSMIWQHYGKVVTFWQQQPSPDFMKYTLPLFGPTVAGGMLTALMGYFAYKRIRGFFSIDSL